jgi:hypothetical protein
MCKRNLRIFSNSVVARRQRRGMGWCALTLTIVTRENAMTLIAKRHVAAGWRGLG